MIWAVIACFALAAALGSYLISRVMTDKPTHKGIAMAHGLFAATGLVLLIVYDLGHTPAPIAATIVFTVAAVGGGVLFGHDIRVKPIPRWLAVGHALLAVTGFVLLVVFAAGAAA